MLKPLSHSQALARKGLTLAIYCDAGLELVDLVLSALSVIRNKQDSEKIRDAEDALLVYNTHAAECSICCHHAPVRLGEIDNGERSERGKFPILSCE